MKTYVIMLDRVPGHELNSHTISAHVDHLRALHKENRLLLCGPFSDFPSGMIVVKARNKEEAIQIAEADPFVKEGARTYSVRTWILANEENDYLRKS